MAHASGNADWQDWPSSATLVTADTLENIEGTADQLFTQEYGATTRTNNAKLQVWTSTNWAIAGSTVVWVKNTITWNVGRDTASGWNPDATASFYTIPYSGRLWDISFRVTTATTTVNAVMYAGIALNGTTVGTNAIGSNSRSCQGGEATPHVYLQGVPLSSGDDLYFYTYNSSAVTAGVTFGGCVPEIMIRDSGPQ